MSAPTHCGCAPTRARRQSAQPITPERCACAAGSAGRGAGLGGGARLLVAVTRIALLARSVALVEPLRVAEEARRALRIGAAALALLRRVSTFVDHVQLADEPSEAIGVCVTVLAVVSPHFALVEAEVIAIESLAVVVYRFTLRQHVQRSSVTEGCSQGAAVHTGSGMPVQDSVAGRPVSELGQQ